MKLFVWALVIAAMMTCRLQASAADKLVIYGSDRRPEIVVTVNNAQLHELEGDLQARAANILSLHLVTNGMVQVLPVAGTYGLKDRELYYTPLYPLGQGLDYEIWYTSAGDTIKKQYHTHKSVVTQAITKPAQVYPLADTLPVNILSFHIRFPQPMRCDKQAYMHVNINAKEGEQLQRVWRQRSYWLDSNRLLLLMIHPGRVKNGIHYIGPVFREGDSYVLTLNDSLPDMNGHMMHVCVTKTFVVAGEDRQLPLIDSVFITKNKKEIMIVFSESMDIATVTEGVKLLDSKGENMECSIRAYKNDKTFTITRNNKVWRRGRYLVQLHKNVSDLAGNRLSRPFEISDIAEKEHEPEFVSKAIVIR